MKATLPCDGAARHSVLTAVIL